MPNHATLASFSFGSCSTAAFWVRRDGRFLEVNRAAEELAGFSRDQLIQKVFGEVFPEYAGEAWRSLWEALSLKRSAKADSLLHGPNREPIPVEITADRIDHDGNELLFVLVADITERRKAEQELRRAASTERSVMECSHDTILLLNPQLIVLFINRTVEGTERHSVIGTSILDHVADRFHDDMKECFRGVLETGHPSSYQVDYASEAGSVTTWEARVAPVWTDSQVTGLTVNARDVTERKEADKALRMSEHSLEVAQEIAKIGSWEYDLLTGRVTGSKQMRRILGMDDESEFPSVDAFVNEFVHEEDRNNVSRSHLDAVSVSSADALDFRVICRPDGRIRHVRAEAEMDFGDDGMPRKIVGTCQDVTAQKNVELALRESEEKFRALTEQSPAIVYIVRSERIIYCNAMLVEVTGFSNAELLSMHFLDFVHPDHREMVAQRHQERIRGEQPPQHYEIKFVRKDGGNRWIDLSTQCIEFEGSSVVLVTCVDVSKRKKTDERLREMETQLAHVSRLSTMGEMVAGIAHEINQPLSAIANFAFASKHVIEEADWECSATVESWLESINQQAVRCGDIIRQLRHFVKKNKGERERVDLNFIVRESVTLIKSDLRHDLVDIQCPEVGDGPFVHFNNVQMQQVLVNLLRNACDAALSAETPEIRVHTLVHDDTATLIVEDNGPGISESKRQRIFDPFFTTKEDGMGMGLAISRSIIESHDGSLDFEPLRPNGAKFVISLPAMAATAASPFDANLRRA